MIIISIQGTQPMKVSRDAKSSSYFFGHAALRAFFPLHF